MTLRLRGLGIVVLSAVALLLALALIPTSAHAARFIDGTNVTVSRAQTINDDVYVGGQTLTINGRINGNLIATGTNITIDGTVTGSVFALGSTLDVTGRVVRDVTFLGGALTVAPQGRIGRDILTANGATTISGQVGRDVRTASGTVTVKNGSVVGGALTYVGDKKPVVAPDARIAGGIDHQSVPVVWGTGVAVIGWLQTLIGLLAFGLLFVWLAPRFGRRTMATLKRTPVMSFVWGLVGVIVVPLVAALVFGLGLLVGGWWLGLMALALYVMALVLSIVVAGLFAGNQILELTGQRSPALAVGLVVGLVLLMAVSIVPVLGGVIMALAMLWALGGLLQTAFRREPPVVPPPLMTEEVRPAAIPVGAGPADSRS